MVDAAEGFRRCLKLNKNKRRSTQEVEGDGLLNR